MPDVDFADPITQRLHRMIDDADTLLKAGKTPSWIREQWIESGTPPALADHALHLVQHELPKARRRATIKLGAWLVGGPILVIGIVLGLMWLVPYVQGPDARAEARAVVSEACDTRPRSVGAIDLGLETVLVNGDGFSDSRIVPSDHERFGDLVLDGRELAVTRVLCGETIDANTIPCSGYYSTEAASLLESSATLDEALSRVSGADADLVFAELVNGGSTVDVTGSRFTVRSVAVGSGDELDRTVINVAPSCPEATSSYSRLSDLSANTDPGPEHTRRAVAELTGVDLG